MARDGDAPRPRAHHAAPNRGERGCARGCRAPAARARRALAGALSAAAARDSALGALARAVPAARGDRTSAERGPGRRAARAGRRPLGALTPSVDARSRALVSSQPMRRLLLALLLCALPSAGSAQEADGDLRLMREPHSWVDVADAVDVDDPFDLNVTLAYVHRRQWGTIQRDRGT